MGNARTHADEVGEEDDAADGAGEEEALRPQHLLEDHPERVSGALCVPTRPSAVVPRLVELGVGRWKGAG